MDRRESEAMVAAIPVDTVLGVLGRLRVLACRLEDSSGPYTAVDRAMGEAISGFLGRVEARGSRPAVDGIVALPLLVHGAQTGDPGPAVPAAMAHVLWWVSARCLDDLSDAPAGQADTESGAHKHSGLLAAVGIACHLSAEVLDVSCPADPITALRLRRELERCGHSALSGQLADLTADPRTATEDEVLASYGGKTGAPYAMSAAMGAVLAGCDAARVEAWRDFGERFGVLRQLVNDQRDLASGRYEDLKNATATLMTVRYLRSVADYERRAAEELLADCGQSGQAREEFAARLTEPGRLREFAASIRPLIDGLHSSIDVLAGAPEFTDGLHELVVETETLYPQFLLGAPSPQR